MAAMPHQIVAKHHVDGPSIVWWLVFDGEAKTGYIGFFGIAELAASL